MKVTACVTVFDGERELPRRGHIHACIRNKLIDNMLMSYYYLPFLLYVWAYFRNITCNLTRGKEYVIDVLP